MDEFVQLKQRQAIAPRSERAVMATKPMRASANSRFGITRNPGVSISSARARWPGAFRPIIICAVFTTSPWTWAGCPGRCCPKRDRQAIHYREKRAVTSEEHEWILSRERNPELCAFFWCCWYLGGSQSDVARLKAEDIDWPNQVVSFFRAKTGMAQIIHFRDGLAGILKGLPPQDHFSRAWRQWMKNTGRAGFNGPVAASK